MSNDAPAAGPEVLTPTLIWRDGTMIPYADATVHISSHMVARGSQIFDVLLAVADADGPRALGLREHVARFVQSTQSMGMTDVPAIDVLERAVAETVVANLAAGGIEPAAVGPLIVKLTASWDQPTMGIEPVTLTPTVHILVTPWASTPAEAAAMFDQPRPIKVKTASMPKIPASVLPPGMKVAAGYTPGIRHHLQAAAEGFDQVLFRTLDGDMAESVTSSFFVVKEGRIAVPPVDSVLDGVTRRAVLDVAQALDIPYRVRAVRWDEVTNADELFLSSTNKTIWPVGQLDDRALDAPGPVSVQLIDAMADLLRGKHELSGRWMTPLIPLAG